MTERYALWQTRDMSSQPIGDAPLPGTGGERSVGEFLLAALSGSALAPFVQAVATKTGEDVYGKIRGLLDRRRRRGPEPEPGKPITLADSARTIVLELPPTLTANDARKLAAVHVPPTAAGRWLLVRHDPVSMTWEAVVIGAPPAAAVESRSATAAKIRLWNR
jgi:hypothetical protein